MTSKMLRIASILLITACFQSVAIAQQTIKCDKLKISFETAQELERYEHSENEVGYENDTLAIDIERKTWSELPENYVKQTKGFAKDLTKALGFNNYKEGGKIPNIAGAYYYIATDKWKDESFPVYVLVAASPKQNCVYEMTVYCYNNDLKEGKRIIESLKLME